MSAGQQSDSREQRAAEPLILRRVAEHLDRPLTPQTVKLASGAKVQVDGVAGDMSAFVEIFARHGALKGGQQKKVSHDALKNDRLGLGVRTSGSGTYYFTRDPNGTPIGERLPDGTTDYYTLDHLGSVTALTSPTGTVHNTYTYDPYGRQEATTGTISNYLRYTAALDISDTGNLYHLGARYYDPNQGRFTQIDPLEQVANLGEANRYLYVGANPINATDPSGLCFVLHCSTYHSISNFGHRLQTSTRLATGCIAGAELGGAIGTAALSPEIGAPIGCATGLAAAAFGGNLGRPELSQPYPSR